MGVSGGAGGGERENEEVGPRTSGRRNVFRIQVGGMFVGYR